MGGVVHACNPSTLRSFRRIAILRPAWATKNKTKN
jgi:hypothetical protein